MCRACLLAAALALLIPAAAPAVSGAGRLITSGYSVVYYTQLGKALRGNVVVAEPDGPRRTLPGGAGRLRDGTLSPNGRYYVFATEAETLPDQPDPGGVYVADLVTAKVRKVARPARCLLEYEGQMTWSRDSLYLFSGCAVELQDAAWRLTVPSGKVVNPYEVTGTNQLASNLVVLTAADGTIYVTLGGEDGRAFDADLKQVTIERASPCLFRVGSRVERDARCLWSHRLDRVAWIDDQNRLLVNGDQKPDGAKVVATSVFADGRQSLSWSPDDRFLLFSSRGLWYLVSSRGDQRATRVLPKWANSDARFFHDAAHVFGCRTSFCDVAVLPTGKRIFTFSIRRSVSPDEAIVLHGGRTSSWDGRCRGADLPWTYRTAFGPLGVHWSVAGGAVARCG